MSQTTQGKRVESPFAADGGLIGEWPKPGDYYLYQGHGWCGLAPNGAHVGLVNHQVTEHEDRTITVAPSILVTSKTTGEWHGYLERGLWREC